MDQLTLRTHQYQVTKKTDMSAKFGEWRVRGLRGATTVSHNSAQAIAEAVDELLNALEVNNPLDPTEIVSVTFSATPDLDAMFPAAVARRRPGWELVPLLDVQQMQVESSLKRCIRVLIHLNTPLSQSALHPIYLREAAQLRPDLAIYS
ncbi:chorismate mutase [Anabaena azotica FACHB-119]|uniref:chorismate mutase n=2 Tax=Anabaena azotica TaxID=197653 RepID=A0ABR8D2W7_9NOST|nr:chorismate mutase [Anabaena azotica FACHB-119]